MKPIKLTRRGLTVGAGASLLAAPFVRLLDARAAPAPAGAAKRLIVFFTPNGTVHRHWRPTGSGRTYAFPKGSILEPLSARRADITVIDGLPFVGARNHIGGMSTMLTGGRGGDTNGQSIDQYVGQRLGAKTRFPSLALGVHTVGRAGRSESRMIYRGPGQSVPANDSPIDVYRRLFGAEGGSAAATSARLKEQRSVLDVVRADMAALRSRLGTPERVKLDAHLQALRDMERGIAGLHAAACRTPKAPELRVQAANDSFPAVGKAQTELLVAALACDMTRVATLQWSHTVGQTVFTWLGQRQTHHALSHMPDSNTQGVAAFVQAERWFATRFAEFLGALDLAKDPVTGASLLDTSVVLWAKELGDGRTHNCNSVPFVVAGRGGGIKLGQLLKPKNGNHQQLLVSLCHAVGLKNQTFGDPSRSKGPLSGLR